MIENVILFYYQFLPGLVLWPGPICLAKLRRAAAKEQRFVGLPGTCGGVYCGMELRF